jgi:hypothetical protein
MGPSLMYQTREMVTMMFRPGPVLAGVVIGFARDRPIVLYISEKDRTPPPRLSFL